MCMNTLLYFWPISELIFNTMQQSSSIEKAFKRMITNYFNQHVYTVKGKDRGRKAWHYVLVDCGKKEQFLEKAKTGSMDVADYSRVLDSGWGQEVPQVIIDTFQKKINLFSLVRLELPEYKKTYYVVADAGKELEMRAASAVEHIRHCGRILYSSNNEDPIEALLQVITEKYLGVAEEINFEIDNRHFDAARNGEIQNVRDHLERGVDVDCTDKNGWTMLHHAAHCGNMDIISFLKDKGANVQVQDRICGRKPIHIAARESHTSAINFFLRNGATISETDKNNWTLLHYAAWKGNLKTVEFLIQNDAEVNNSKDMIDGKKPIHVAAEYGNTGVAEVLLKEGANIDDCDEIGRTPFYYAVRSGQLETAKYLFSKGADINIATTLGTKPMHAAVDGNIETIKFCLDHGLNVDEQDNGGWTVLHHAADGGNMNIVQLLVNRKANINAVDKEGKTPFDFGKKCTDIASYLANRMGKMFLDQEKYSDALKVYKEILEIQKEKLGQDHSETLKTHNKVAVVLYEQGLYDEAMDIFKDVLRNRERCLGSNHMDTLRSKHGLGLVYSAQIKLNEAMEILKKVFEEREANLGTNHHDTLDVARDMAYVHFKKGEYDEAFDIFKDIFEKRRRHFETDHPATLQVKQDMAVVLVNKADYKGALQIFKDVLDKRTTTLGNDHPDTLCTRRHISIISQRFEKELQESSNCSIQ